MGKESPLTLSQRGPDAREEVPMRTPKRLYAEERIMALVPFDVSVAEQMPC